MFIFRKYMALITKLIIQHIYRRVDRYTRHFQKSRPVSKGSATRGYYVSRYPSGTGTLRRVPGYFNTHGMPYTLNTDSTSSLNSSIMASVAVRPSVYPHGFCFHSYHHQSSYQDHAPFLPQPQPVVAKPPPTDPYYGHEETTKYVLGL